jgi:hypothetical protein
VHPGGQRSRRSIKIGDVERGERQVQNEVTGHPGIEEKMTQGRRENLEKRGD